MNPTSVPKPLSLLRSGALAFALVLLAACTTTGQDASAVGGANGQSGATTGAGEASSPNQGQKTARAVLYDPEEFIGYRPQRLLPILGAPDFVRRDGPAQIWQYRAENCVLDLFLYGKNDDSQVRHVELRERVPGVEPVEQCFSRLRAARQGKPTS